MGNFRLSPSTTALAMNLLSLIRFSIGCGATNLPPAVLIRSFLRSVILRYPSASSSPISPVWNQPSASIASAVAPGGVEEPGDVDRERRAPGQEALETAARARAQLGEHQPVGEGILDGQEARHR